MRVGYGICSANMVVNYIYFGGGERTVSLPTTHGAPIAELRYFITNSIGIGLIGSKEFLIGTTYNFTGAPKFRGTYTRSIRTIAPELTVVIIHRKKILFYTALAIGKSVDDTKFHYSYYDPAFFKNSNSLPSGDHSDYVNAHAAAGLRLGGTIGGFAEAGLGFKGLIHCGLSVML